MKTLKWLKSLLTIEQTLGRPILQCLRGNKQSVLFFQRVNSQWQVHKACESIYFPNTSKLHRSARKPYVPVSVIHAWPTFPSFPLAVADDTRGIAVANNPACLAAELPLASHKPSQPAQVGNQLPSWQKCIWPHFHCIYPASIWKFALHICHPEQPRAKFCSSLLRPELAAAISQGDCTNVESWEFSYSSPAKINHFESIRCLKPPEAGVTSKSSYLLHPTWLTFDRKKLYHRHTE